MVGRNTEHLVGVIGADTKPVRRPFPTPHRAQSLVILSLECVQIHRGAHRDGKPFGQVPFQANVELLRLFLTHREDIVESIEAVLNPAKADPVPVEPVSLSRHFEDCFCACTAVTASQERLRPTGRSAALYTAFMTITREHSLSLRFFPWASVAVAIMAVAFVAQGQEQQPNASDIADGMRLFEQKGNCQACHGWAADGHKTDSQMPDGANLRETKLDRTGLALIIKCGKLNSQMPAFDKFAYSDGRCYGKTQADLKSYPTRMPDPPATLQQREINLVVDFLIAKVIGKGPMDRAKCIEFWGSETDVCKQFSK
jgi:hypothetical protein